MITISDSNVTAAFDLLLEEIDQELFMVNQMGAQAFQDGRYEQIEATRDHAVKLHAHRDKLKELRAKWPRLSQNHGQATNSQRIIQPTPNVAVPSAPQQESSVARGVVREDRGSVHVQPPVALHSSPSPDRSPAAAESKKYNPEPVEYQPRRRRGSDQDNKITHEKEYELPILRVLIEMGGSGRKKEVLKKVQKAMSVILTPTDDENLPSKNTPRWENKAEWARYRMVEQGWLRKGSPRGMWEISDKGRQVAEGKSS